MFEKILFINEKNKDDSLFQNLINLGLRKILNLNVLDYFLGAKKTISSLMIGI